MLALWLFLLSLLCAFWVNKLKRYGGHIPIKLIRMTLSLGVGLAIALSMVRIIVPEVKLWYFIVPGFAIAAFLSFADPVFVGIAYDAGGVASGPMTATFVLAFAQEY